MHIRKLVGLFQAGLFDLACGPFIAHVVHKTLHHEHPTLWIYPLASLISVLPDADILLKVSRRQEIDTTHRDTVLHQPLPMILIPGTLLTLVSWFWALIWTICLLAHYLHDTLEQEGGIPWLAPFRYHKYNLLNKDRAGRYHLLTTWPPEDKGVGLDDWLNRVYYRLTLKSVGEPALALVMFLIIAFTW